MAHGRVHARHVKAAVGRLQWRNLHPLAASSGTQATSEPRRGQLAPPSASTVAPRPRAAARRRWQSTRRRRHPNQPAVAHVQHHASCTQPRQPGAEQRRGLHVGGKDAPRGADKRIDAQALRPGAQLLGAKDAQQRLDLCAALAEARHKGPKRLGGSDSARPAGQQNLRPTEGHGVEHMHRMARLGQYFGSHQPGRAPPMMAASRAGRAGRIVHIRHAPIIPPCGPASTQSAAPPAALQLRGSHHTTKQPPPPARQRR